jgi:transcriptional regulator GlxA family with amidase domain
VSKTTDHRVAAVVQAMAENLKQNPSIEELAQRVNLSVNRLELLFKQEFDCSPLQYLTRLRLTQACTLLETTELRVCQIMRQVGFTQTGYFSAIFRAAFACTPKEYRTRYRQQLNALPAD